MFKKRLYYVFILIVVLLSVGTLFYNIAEEWSYVDSFYFSTVTLTTIGFGDLVPTTDAAKIFTSVYALFGIGIMLYILSSVIGVFVFKQERYFDKLFFPVRKIKRKEKEMEKKAKKIEKVEKKLEREEKKIEKEEDVIEDHVKRIRAKEREIDKEEEEIERLKRKIKKKAK